MAETTPVGDPISYELAEDGSDRPRFGVFGFANCTCGSTLGIGSQNVEIATHDRIVAWATARMRATGLTPRQFLTDLRNKLRTHVSTGATRGKAGGPRG